MTPKLRRGELEAQVLELLWAEGQPLTPREVHLRLCRQRPLAYTTVTTILVRLWRKGLLVRERSGRAFTYVPVETREERAASRMRELLAASGDRGTALSRFVESLPDAELSELRRVLRRSGRRR